MLQLLVVIVLSHITVTIFYWCNYKGNCSVCTVNKFWQPSLWRSCPRSRQATSTTCRIHFAAYWEGG